MSFMKPEVYRGAYYSVDTTAGTEIVPVEVCGIGPSVDAEALAQYCEGSILDEDETLTMREGWLGRMSAPGYLDCTAWTAYSSEQMAREALATMYGDEE